MTERLLVPFSGDGTGTGPLSWGQRTVWRGIKARGSPINLTGVLRLPEGTSAEDVAEELGFLMSRHQSLRTRFPPGPGDLPQQQVSGSGETYLEVIDVDDGADPLAAARALEAEYEFHRRDYGADWPVRRGVIRQRGSCVYKVTAVCHLTTDGFGVMAMLADLAARDPVTGRPAGPITAMYPLEQAQWQAGPAGRRHQAAVMRHWRSMLRAVPLRRFPESRDERTPRYWEAVFRSPAAYLAIQAIAARMGVDTSPVLLAAFAVMSARVSGINPAAPRVMVNNRFRPRLADTVSPIAQTCLCVVDVAGITFDEAVRRTVRASMAAYKNAYFEPYEIAGLIAAVSEERGEEIDINFVYNDRRMGGPRTVTGPPPTAGQVRAALPGTTLTWDQGDALLDLCHFHIRDAADAIDVNVLFDTHYAGPAAIERILRGVEEITVAAASDPAIPTGV